jgi:hypothetical protein
MYPVCSSCGQVPVVAWFEGPSFRDAVNSADKARAEGAWLACAVCLRLVEANDREGLVDRGLARQRRKDRDKGRIRTPGDEAMLRPVIRDHFDRLFWTPRAE